MTATHQTDNKPATQISLNGFAFVFGEDPKMTFGPLWNAADNVLVCLARYAKQEGHNAAGMTVADFADDLVRNPYEASHEEIIAIIRLYQLGRQSAVIS